jgi:hypothetical protein
MNQSEQIREQLNTLSELEHLLPTLLLEVDKQLVLEVQERLKALTDTTERILQMLEIGSDLLQKARSSLEGDPSSQGNRLDGEDHQDKFVSSSPQDEPHRDTSVAGISSQASTEVFYIGYRDHKSTEGCYVSKPDEDTRFQITVPQSNPLVGILQFYAELDSYEKECVIESNSKLIKRDRGPFGSSQGTLEEDGEVRLDPERKHWELKTPITIKS